MYADESKMIEVLKDEALKVIQGARISLLRSRPFYGTLLSSMPLVADWHWLSTAATDHRNIFFNPEFIMGMPEERKKKVFNRVDNHPNMSQTEKDDYKKYVNLFYRKKTPREVVFILMHEIRHITNDHIARGKGLDSEKYNVASDQYINTDLVVEDLGPKAQSLKFFPDGKQTIFQAGKEFEFLSHCYCDFKFHGKTAEEIYKDLYGKDLPKGKPLGVHIGDYEPDLDLLGYTDPHPYRSPVEKDNDLSWSSSMIEAAFQAAGGEGPKEVRDFVARIRKPKIDYLKIIKQRMLSRIRSNLSFSRLSRRSGSVTRVLRNYGALTESQSVVFPGRKKQTTIDIVIGFDVSGSISNNTLERIFSEIAGLCTLYPYFRVTMFCWSTKVGNVVVYTPENIHEMKDYKITSTGGTSASCAFEYIEKNIPDAKEVIIFTDGFIEDLSNRKDWANAWQTLWVLCGRGRATFKPPFGKGVDLDDKYQ